MNMMVQRSLDGLIAFLTGLFPYLPDAEALAYIDAAAADPLVAALLIINRRALTIDSFVTTASVKIALRSAAVAAKHPDPERFVQGWKLASLSPEKLATELMSPYNNKNWYEKTLYFVGLLDLGPPTDDLQLDDLWKLAKDRLPSGTERALLREGRLPSARGAMKRMLLSVIHGYYLKALAALPKQELAECYHRSLLIGGHCYGPLHPVSNIIVNTLWYEQSFPPAIQVQPLKVISTDCLWRIAARSLYGLVTFLCNRNRYLDPDQALHDLLVAQADLSVADPLHLEGKKTGRRGATAIGAYLAAAKSARHPRPNLQAKFLGAPKNMQSLLAFSDWLLPVVSKGRTLDKQSFECLITLFRSPSSVGMAFSQHEGREPEQLRLEAYLNTCTAKKRFWDMVDRVGRKVEAALHKFNETAVPKYNLHVICGVNEFVEMEFSLDPEVRAYNPWTPYKYHYSHINFLATCEGSPDPELFFAECGNHGTDTSWCVPVPLHPDAGISQARQNVGMRPEAARCIYCEDEMGRIWHPLTERFHGRDNFEKFDGNYYSNDTLLSDKGYKVDWIDEVADDAIYSNCSYSGLKKPISSNGIVSWL